MFARQSAQGKQPILGPLQGIWVKIERLGEAGKRVLRGAKLDHRALNGAQRIVKPTLGPLGQAIKPAAGIAHRPFGPLQAKGRIRACQILAHFRGGLHQATAGIKCGLFAGLRVKLIQLGHGMAQEIFFGLHTGKIGLGRDQGLLRRAMGRPACA